MVSGCVTLLHGMKATLDFSISAGGCGGVMLVPSNLALDPIIAHPVKIPSLFPPFFSPGVGAIPAAGVYKNQLTGCTEYCWQYLIVESVRYGWNYTETF